VSFLRHQSPGLVSHDPMRRLAYPFQQPSIFLASFKAIDYSIHWSVRLLMSTDSLHEGKLYSQGLPNKHLLTLKKQKCVEKGGSKEQPIAPAE
jgi:hypothetical protein